MSAVSGPVDSPRGLRNDYPFQLELVDLVRRYGFDVGLSDLLRVGVDRRGRLHVRVVARPRGVQ